VRQALAPMRRCRNSLIGTAEQGTAKKYRRHPVGKSIRVLQHNRE
jgi:hypothetical protein